MTFDDWTLVIDEAAGAGATDVQFIGGEPTLHPRLPDLINHARGKRLGIEVFSNLFRITPSMWEVLNQPGVTVATSYYSDDAGEHDSIVRRHGAHTRTTANIAEAVRRGIPLRTGVIDVRDGHRVPGALLQLERLGVTNVGTDRLRQVGRGERDQTASVDQLCGDCVSGVLAVAPDGTVWPCVFTRWLPVGNVHEASLADILAGESLALTTSDLQTSFDQRLDPSGRCGPDACNPQCGPGCGPACQPQYRTPCRPRGGCAPDYGRCNPDKQLCRPDRDCGPNKCRPTS